MSFSGAFAASLRRFRVALLIVPLVFAGNGISIGSPVLLAPASVRSSILTAAAGKAESLVHAFTSANGDGAQPRAGLIADSHGALYGTTTRGGIVNSCSGGCGTVFKLKPPLKGQSAWTETVLYIFTGANGDGYEPFAGLIEDASGALYGTTAVGGSKNCRNGCGTVFKLTPPAPGHTGWTESILYTFTNAGGDGETPWGGLIADSSGALYGTTAGGGVSCGQLDTCGTVFRLTPPAPGQTAWTEQVLYAFTGPANGDGAYPYAGLIADASGALFGTTYVGGAYNVGTVFKLTPPAAGKTAWTESVLYSFTGAGGHGNDGVNPVAGVIADANGALYGTTYGGAGNASDGTVFKLTPPAPGQTTWTESVLHSFSAQAHGQNPEAGVIMDSSGALYGTTYFGGSIGWGTVFKLAPPAAGKTAWTETVLHSFTDDVDGANPVGGVIANASGTLFGTTYSGGSLPNCSGSCYGTVFKLQK